MILMASKVGMTVRGAWQAESHRYSKYNHFLGIKIEGHLTRALLNFATKSKKKSRKGD